MSDGKLKKMKEEDTKLKPRFFQLCPACLQFAWEWKTKPFMGMPFNPTMVIHRDNPKLGDEMRCQFCHGQIFTFYLNEGFLYTVWQKIKNEKSDAKN